MKKEIREKFKVLDKDIQIRESQREWAITILPDGIRIDNFHGLMHIHLELGGKKHPTIENKPKIREIVISHIEKNSKIIKKELREELR
ncbi:hypothetical protein [Methanobrevibacter filiformis]|uniref:Uncharacterized protein n=1 Tax=Methanobrevibacter filiformis TaxID=55758 RepID=A0A166DK70_9EURY|nr:hypothetical protein [Methanobrevibacter filiformis]KZX15681.1 hypothetical protein MBFIL_06190 [Methanobrevibacter filiformis]